MATDFAMLDALYPLPAEELSRQWLLCRDPSLGPDAWRRESLAGHHLFAHPDARICRLLARNGVHIGWAIEPLAYLGGDGGTLPEASLTLPVDPELSAAAAEAVLYGRGPDGWSDGRGLVGNWTAILLSPEGGIRRVYLSASHSVVYAPAREIVATSHNLVPGLERDEALSRAVDPLATLAYYTFGLTAFQGLERLLPNHALDLLTFRPLRHWPNGGLAPRIAPDDAVRRIVDHAHRLIELLASAYPAFKLPLSAGRDSRAILAILEPLARAEPERLRLFTSERAGLEARIDVQIARRLARRACLPLAVNRVAGTGAAPEAVARAFVRLGESKHGPILGAPGVTNPPPADIVLSLPGMAGETARAFYWQDRSPGMEDATPEALLRRTRTPLCPATERAAAAWLDGLPAGVRAEPRDLLDLAYVEQRMGCWDSSTRYLFPGRGRANLSLMATTLALETMLRLPADYRAAGTLQRDIVAHGWPALLDLPFNEPVGTLKLKTDIERRIRWRARQAAGAAARLLSPRR